MNSTGNLLHEVARLDVSRFSRCRVYFRGVVGEGTAWGYRIGAEPFEVEITPQQAYFLALLQERESQADELEQIVLDSLPDVLINRFKGEIEISSMAQIALYDFFE